MTIERSERWHRKHERQVIDTSVVDLVEVIQRDNTNWQSYDSEMRIRLSQKAGNTYRQRERLNTNKMIHACTTQGGNRGTEASW